MTSFMKYKMMNQYNSYLIQEYMRSIVIHSNTMNYQSNNYTRNSQQNNYTRNSHSNRNLQSNHYRIRNKELDNHRLENRIVIDDKKVVSTQNQYLHLLHPLNNLQRLTHLNKLKHIKYFDNEHHYSKSVELLDNYIVKKTLKYNFLGVQLFKNELNALFKLSNYPHFPKLIAYDPKHLIIYMSYCGVQISRYNLPTNWKEQIREIHCVLEKQNVNSNDMLLRNTCILDNQIYIIDFGLNSVYNDSIKYVISNFYNNLNHLAITNG